MAGGHHTGNVPAKYRDTAGSPLERGLSPGQAADAVAGTVPDRTRTNRGADIGAAICPDGLSLKKPIVG